MSKKSKATKNPMTPDAVARIQGSTCRKNGGTTPKGSQASRAQRTVAKG